MPDSKASDRLSESRAATGAQDETAAGSVDRRRAVTKTRRTRWALEDSARIAAEDEGRPETPGEFAIRAVTRMQEATRDASRLDRDRPEPLHVETTEERASRVSDEEEIARELAE